MILTLRKTIPSSSHNAPWTEELGEHWPAGQRFKLLDKRRQQSCRKFYRLPDTSTVVEQVGGEEVLVSIPTEKFPELFGIELVADEGCPIFRRFCDSWLSADFQKARDE